MLSGPKVYDFSEHCQSSSVKKQEGKSRRVRHPCLTWRAASVPAGNGAATPGSLEHFQITRYCVSFSPPGWAAAAPQRRKPGVLLQARIPAATAAPCLRNGHLRHSLSPLVLRSRRWRASFGYDPVKTLWVRRGIRVHKIHAAVDDLVGADWRPIDQVSGIFDVEPRAIRASGR